MRDKKVLVGAIAIVVILILVIFAAMFSATPDEPEPEGGVFGDTSGTRTDGDVVDLDVDGERNLEDMQYAGEEGTDEAPMLRALFDGPVAGAVAMEADGTQVARFVARETGHIHETPLTTVKESTTKRTDTILRIGKADWASDGEHVVLRRLGNEALSVYSYVSPVSSDGEGHHLPDNILTLAVSPAGDKVFYLVAAESGGSVGYVETLSAETRTEVFTSPLKSYTATWHHEDEVLLYTKPSSLALGYVWILNPNTGAVERILGNLYALAALGNKDGSRIAYSLQENSNDIISLRVVDTESGEVAQLPKQTIIEKCAWGTVATTTLYCAFPSNIITRGYLESWYYGTLKSNDVLWQVDVDTLSIRRVLDPIELTTDAFDIVDLHVSPQEDFILFRTKQDDILWAARIPDDLLPRN